MTPGIARGDRRRDEIVRRQMRGLEGQAHGKSRALALPAVGSDGATVDADQFFDQSQTDSAALGRPGAC